jgi:DNA polymerase
MKLQYPDLQKSGGRWTYATPEGARSDLYGGKLLENVIQALARIVVTTAELRLAHAGLRSALSVHDELVFVVKRKHAEVLRGAVQKTMERKVAWLPELPVAAEVNYGDNYGDVK